MKRNTCNYLLIFLLVFNCTTSVLGQNRKIADDYFNLNDFESAYEEYSLLIESGLNDSEIDYRVAVCVLNLNMAKTEAIKILEVIVKKEGSDPNALFLLGRAYQYDFRFTEAIKIFSEFEKKGQGSNENLKSVGRQIEHCQNAIEIMKFPIEIKFENLGIEVNSPFAEYFPFAASDESFLFFNSRRNNGGNKGSDGSYSSDVFISVSDNGKFLKAKSVNKKINSKEFDEEIVGLASSNTKAVLYFRGKTETDGKLGLVDVKNHDLINRKNLPDVINSKYDEISASVNNLSKEIYFASNKPGGYGGTDIYVTRLLPNGEWGDPQNLGPTINTIYDEDFPVLSSDGKILYFSSTGHTSMGGYDIFKADYDIEKMKYVQPRNLGFPINTPMDEMNFSISESGRYGYISAFRKEGFGDLDIYRVTFSDIEPDYTVYNGKLILPEGESLNSISMIVTDDKTGELYGEYLPNLSSMRYVLILPPGKYTLTIETDNFSFYEEKIEVLDKDAFQYEIIKDIELKK
jgi:tetratricopeptide (TPR) repeat protein